MSVINQLLLDLEKRRASAAERSALPDHVRPLPQPEGSLHWGWIAAGSTGAAVLLVSIWALLSGFDWTPQRAAAAPQSAPPAAIARQRVAAVPAGATAPAKPAADGGSAGSAQEPAPASRLSFELSDLPDPADSARAAAETAPVATARVLAPPEPESSKRDKAQHVPAERAESRKPAAVVAAVKPAAKSEASPEIRKKVHQPTPRELAESEYGKATVSLHQGRLAEAQAGFEAVLSLHPAHHGARQALVGLLLEDRKFGDAERALQEGLALAPAQTGFAMTLARLQVDRGDNAQAVVTLEQGLDYARANAEYLAFFAALLQRQGRHGDAIAQYQAALRLKPAAGVWWLGLGISLQAVNRAADAQAAYHRARATNSLNAELASFAEQRLRQLQ